MITFKYFVIARASCHKVKLTLAKSLDKNIEKIGKGSSLLLTLRTAVWRVMFTLLEAKTIKLLFPDRKSTSWILGKAPSFSINQTTRSSPIKCDWLQIMTDNQINPYDWLDLTIILFEKVKVSPWTSSEGVRLYHTIYFLAFRTKIKERHSSCKMKLLFVITFFLCISVGKFELNPYFFSPTNFIVA